MNILCITLAGIVTHGPNATILGRFKSPVPLLHRKEERYLKPSEENAISGC